MAFECLCDKLGRLFEPYVIHTLPLLLSAFGDASPAVREAAADAARAIMGQLSACEFVCICLHFKFVCVCVCFCTFNL